MPESSRNAAEHICVRCGEPITGGRDTYTLAPHVWPYYGPMHWPTSRCPRRPPAIEHVADRWSM